MLGLTLIKISVVASEYTRYLFNAAKLGVLFDLIVDEDHFAVVVMAAELQLLQLLPQLSWRFDQVEWLFAVCGGTGRILI